MDSKQLIEGIPDETVIELRKQIYGLLGKSVGKYKMDESLPWEERYKLLEKHHIEETEFLIALAIKWGNTVKGLDAELAKEQKQNEELLREYTELRGR